MLLCIARLKPTSRHCRIVELHHNKKQNKKLFFSHDDPSFLYTSLPGRMNKKFYDIILSTMKRRSDGEKAEEQHNTSVAAAENAAVHYLTHNVHTSI